MKNTRFASICSLALIAFPGVTSADSLLSAPRSVGISADVSILMGIGVSVGVPVGDRFNIRGTYHGFTYSDEFENDDDDSAGNTTYDADLKLSSLGLMADWHPFKGGFRFTTGIVSNGNRLNLNAQDNGGFIDIGDCSYQSASASDPLNLRGALDWKRVAPYVGIGWGGNLNASSGFYGLFDIGVLLSGAPDVRASVSGLARSAQPGCSNNGGTFDTATDPSAQEQLRKEVAEINEDTKDFKVWPNIAFGLGYRF